MSNWVFVHSTTKSVNHLQFLFMLLEATPQIIVRSADLTKLTAHNVNYLPNNVANYLPNNVAHSYSSIVFLSMHISNGNHTFFLGVYVGVGVWGCVCKFMSWVQN